MKAPEISATVRRLKKDSQNLSTQVNALLRERQEAFKLLRRLVKLWNSDDSLDFDAVCYLVRQAEDLTQKSIF